MCQRGVLATTKCGCREESTEEQSASNTNCLKRNGSRASAVAASLGAYARSGAAETFAPNTICCRAGTSPSESRPGAATIYLPQPGGWKNQRIEEHRL
jgi:uncharacterized protein (DUF3084 family)